MVPRLVVPGLLALTVLGACGGNVVAVSTETHSFTMLGAAPLVVVETINGKVDVRTGAEGAVSVEVRKSASAWSEAEAVRQLADVLVMYSQDGDHVTVTVTDIGPGQGNKGGAVSLVVPQHARLDLATTNGKVVTFGTLGEIRAKSTNGDVGLSGGAGTIQATTTNGRISVSPASACLLAASTSNGSVTFRGELAEGDSTLETSNGSVDISLPAAAAFQVDAQTTNGSITCDFPLSNGSVSNDELHGTVGGNSGVHLHATTRNGRIDLHRF